jgi:phenylacetate-coenzyme A ligase PaaK-like adenylate-forming protein
MSTPDRLIRAFLETLRKTQFMRPEEMREYQRALLERLLRHARAHVPFYRDSGRLAPLFRADDSIDWDRWQDIPPLTRKDVQVEFERLKSELLPPEHGRVWLMSTAGSTGEPVKVLQTDLAMRWAWAALRLRDFEWHGIDPTRRLAFLYPFTPDDFDITGIRKSPAWRPEFKTLNLAGERIDIADTRPATELIEVVASVRPAYLQTPPTPLQLMIGHDRRRLLSDLKLAAVFSYGEHFPPDSKRQVEQHLGCKVLELYGSSECNYFASACARCGNFHVHAEVAMVEAVDDGGQPVSTGETGRLLVTPLYNYAMPLIRYDHDDFAQLASNGCDIKLPALAAIFGKKRMPFMRPDGRVMRPMLLADVIVELLGARTIQVAQTAPNRCEVRIVPGSLPPEEMRFDEMTKLLRSIWWDGLQVDYRVVDEFPRSTPRAKFQMFKQEFYNPSDFPGS